MRQSRSNRERTDSSASGFHTPPTDGRRDCAVDYPPYGSSIVLATGLLSVLLSVVPCTAQQTPQEAPGATLQPFQSVNEYVRFNRQLAWEYERRVRRRPPPPSPPASPPAPSAGTAESITNVQHAGVDEGGIVQVHGDHLVILRRGRLFTVRIGQDRLPRSRWPMPSARESIPRVPGTTRS